MVTVGRSILGWGIAAVAAGGVAFGLGAAGVLVQQRIPPATIELVGAVPGLAPAYDCPGGLQVTAFAPDARILVTGRSADGSWLVTRNPTTGFETVWVDARLVSVDAFPVPFDQLPIVECATGAVEESTG